MITSGALLLAALGLLTVPLQGGATITGPCSATAVAASSAIDVTSQSVWHVRNSDVIVGAAHATAPQSFVKIRVVVFGIALPVAPISDRQGTAATSGSGGGIRVADYSRFSRVFSIQGTTNACTWRLTIVVDDVSVFGSVVGLVAAVLTLIGLLGFLIVALMRSPILGRVLGAILGLFGGIGFAELLQQAGVLDPSTVLDLAVPVAAMLAGILIAGTLARGRVVPSLNP